MAISARPDSIGQGRVLRLLRDEGSTSRAQLGELAGMTRSKLEAEVSRLIQVGLTSVVLARMAPAAAPGQEPRLVRVEVAPAGAPYRRLPALFECSSLPP